jgi:phosphopantothenoylcysteine decarboxylase/phosphopantothenate--cysteine ligase
MQFKGELNGKKVLVTAGPTQGAIDPVRYISNHSSGKMGYSIAIFCAAVADYRPVEVAEQKIKKDDDELVIRMIRNKDIAYEFGKLKAKWQYAVGFALETHDEREHALAEMQRKGMDMVVEGGGEMQFPLKPKETVAEDIQEAIQRDYLINRTTKEYAR